MERVRTPLLWKFPYFFLTLHYTFNFFGENTNFNLFIFFALWMQQLGF